MSTVDLVVPIPVAVIPDLALGWIYRQGSQLLQDYRGQVASQAARDQAAGEW